MIDLYSLLLIGLFLCTDLYTDLLGQTHKLFHYYAHMLLFFTNAHAIYLSITALFVFVFVLVLFACLCVYYCTSGTNKDNNNNYYYHYYHSLIFYTLGINDPEGYWKKN